MSLLFFSLIAISSDIRLESKLVTPSGVIERFVSLVDERDFSVKLTRPDGKILWLESAPTKIFSTDEHILRRAVSAAHDEVVLESSDRQQILGLAPRVFEKAEEEFNCEAIARIEFPTALNESTDILLSKLKCLGQTPRTENLEFKVLGRANKSWVSCDPHEKNCVWNSSAENEPEANAQAATLAFLSTAKKSLELEHLAPSMRSLRAKSWASNADKSSYDANLRLLSYGAGKFLDARDGFIVTHEWGHAVIDDLNPGLFGYEASVLHEAVADFIAADIFDSPCFAPFDAQEVPKRKCVRDLSVEKKFPADISGDDPHGDSPVLSGTLWDARKIFPPHLTLEVTLETILRLPKSPGLKLFWSKFTDVYERLLLERADLKDQRSELEQIGQKHGLGP